MAPVKASLCRIPTGLASGLEGLNVSSTDVLRAAKQPSQLFNNPGQRIPVSGYFELWRAIGQVSNDPGIGLALVRSIEASHTEPLFLAVLSSANVGEALEVVASYKRALSPESLEVSRKRGKVMVTYAWGREVGEPPRELIDAELAFLVEMSRRATRHNALGPCEVQLRQKQADAADAARVSYFGCPVLRGSRHNGLVFNEDDLERPFLTFNPQLTSALLPHLHAQVPANAPTPLSRVRDVVSRQLQGRRPTVRSVGRDLALSGRSLQRLLREHQTSFREVVVEVRRQQAEAYLRDTAFSDGEVAFLLGFEDPNSFYRAFRSWTGMAPSEVRRNQAFAPHGLRRES